MGMRLWVLFRYELVIHGRTFTVIGTSGLDCSRNWSGKLFAAALRRAGSSVFSFIAWLIILRCPPVKWPPSLTASCCLQLGLQALFASQNFGLSTRTDSERLRDRRGLIVPKPVMLDSTNIPLLIEIMRICQDGKPQSQFGDFFFDTWCDGIKAPYRGSVQNSLVDVDWALVDPATAYIDVGAEVLPIVDCPLVGVPMNSSHRDLISQLFGSVNSSAYRHRHGYHGIYRSHFPFFLILILHVIGMTNFCFYSTWGGFASYLKSGIPNSS
ncbi:uncharacterized protein BYT42DRAFT_575724 [Radiomyces spectabilis]|uniref:uncharacterized protein n=1 Tax=Radiomyces spectabilis TaxID=64574 RepID=UPI00221EEEF0|nr:uncharacterized protein BYT42DRAFT_575724 [Radiomyces spectabilis]KAI8374258.1 hypothetical protein BYT42DRAFT_575724 [Radiomyces spectabilis]